MSILDSSLKPGNQGPAVLALNQTLYESHFLSKEPDDKFDDVTKQAIIDVQYLVNLYQTGTADNTIIEIINELSKDRMTRSIAIPRNLMIGQRNIFVYLANQALKQKKFIDKKPDNFFDEETLLGARRLQAQLGLSSEDHISQEAWNGLFGVSPNKDGHYYAQVPLFPGILRLDSKGASVKLLNNRLKELGILNRRVGEVFDERTEEAVRLYQQTARLIVDGIVGQNTWAALFGVDLNMIHFVEWFNAFQRRSVFFNRPIQNTLEFAEVFVDFTRILGKPQMTLNEFIGYFNIIFNETGGTFRPLSEFGPNQSNPDDFVNDAYFFKRIPNKKLSYNQDPNVPAGDLLRSWGVINQEKDVLAWNRTDVYPWDQPDKIKRRARDCDFYKFRGRGLNQVTWRTGYNSYVAPIFTDGKNLEEMTNSELDAEFQKPNVYCCVFKNYMLDPFWAGKAIPSLISGDFSELPKYVAGFLATAYHRLFVDRCQSLKNAILDNEFVLQADERITF